MTVEEYSTALRTKRDRLESVWSAVNLMKRRKKDAAIVKDYLSMKQELDSCQTVRFNSKPRLPQMAYINEGSKSKNYEEQSHFPLLVQSD